MYVYRVDLSDSGSSVGVTGSSNVPIIDDVAPSSSDALRDSSGSPSQVFSDDQFTLLDSHLSDLADLGGSILYSLNTGIVIFAAFLVFIVLWQIFRIAFGR